MYKPVSKVFVSECPHKWISFLPWVEIWYNISYHVSAGLNHYQIIYSHPPPYILMYTRGNSSLEALDYDLLENDAVLA